MRWLIENLELYLDNVILEVDILKRADHCINSRTVYLLNKKKMIKIKNKSTLILKAATRMSPLSMIG